MILCDFKVIGREFVIEYEPHASWRHVSFHHESNRDLHIFAGKFAFIKSNHCKPKPQFLTMGAALATALAALVITLTTQASGNSPSDAYILAVMNDFWGLLTVP